MCGIAGFSGHGDRGDLLAMMHAIRHRGPDGKGMHQEEAFGLFLGHVRLSVVDLDGGHQPMWNENGSIGVSFNGEIYNHQELRHDLETRGHRFATDHSDTEVLVHGWEEWGKDLPSRLNGMFAFAVWDRQARTLFLARDRFGEKPLYWGHQHKTFYFASEISAIKAHSKFRAHYDPLVLKKYFAYGFVPSPHAIFRDIYKLPAGHWLQFDLETHNIQTQAFWRFRVEPMEKPPSLDEAAEEVRALLMRSVERRLMSDVPLGVFLSGGIDSSFATAAMCRVRAAEEVQSFAIGFREQSFDESGFAREMSQALGTTHHESILDSDGAKHLIDEVLERLDEPLGDASILPTYLLSHFVRSKVTVALSGDGGDELFAGYDPFAALKLAGIYHALTPGFVHKGMRRLAEVLPKSVANMSFDFKVRRFLQGLEYGPELWNPAWMAPLELSDIEDVFNEPVCVEELYEEALALWRESPEKSIVDKSLEYYSNFYLPDDILTKVDRASMLNGLETRSVYLDNDLVEFVRHLPASYKFDGKNGKIVLKKAARGFLPSSILNRPKKGFGIPLQAWLADMALSHDGANKLDMSSREISKRIRDHQDGRADHRLFLWNWVVLQKTADGRDDR